MTEYYLIAGTSISFEQIKNNFSKYSFVVPDDDLKNALSTIFNKVTNSPSFKKTLFTQVGDLKVITKVDQKFIQLLKSKTESNSDDDSTDLSTLFPGEEKGKRVEVRLEGWAKHHGKITRKNLDGTFDILVDDNERKSKVSKNDVLEYENVKLFDLFISVNSNDQEYRRELQTLIKAIMTGGIVLSNSDFF